MHVQAFDDHIVAGEDSCSMEGWTEEWSQRRRHTQMKLNVNKEGENSSASRWFTGGIFTIKLFEVVSAINQRVLQDVSV